MRYSLDCMSNCSSSRSYAGVFHEHIIVFLIPSGRLINCTQIKSRHWTTFLPCLMGLFFLSWDLCLSTEFILGCSCTKGDCFRGRTLLFNDVNSHRIQKLFFLDLLTYVYLFPKEFSSFNKINCIRLMSHLSLA